MGKRICSEFERLARLVQHVPVVQGLYEPAEAALLDLAAKKNVGADVEIVGEREVLIDRLNAHPARVHGRCEHGRPAVEGDRALFRVVDAGDAFDEGRFARPVVAEKPDDLAAGNVEADVVDSDEAAEDFRQAAN